MFLRVVSIPNTNNEQRNFSNTILSFYYYMKCILTNIVYKKTLTKDDYR